MISVFFVVLLTGFSHYCIRVNAFTSNDLDFISNNYEYDENQIKKITQTNEKDVVKDEKDYNSKNIFRYYDSKHPHASLTRFSQLEIQLQSFIFQGTNIIFIAFLLQAVNPLLLLILTIVGNTIVIIAVTDYFLICYDLNHVISIPIFCYLIAISFVVIITLIAASYIFMNNNSSLQTKLLQEKLLQSQLLFLEKQNYNYIYNNEKKFC